MLKRLLQFASDHELLRPGDRVAVAVSGGADSLALLRLLLEARGELGIVLSVAHFNHRIRGSAADQDEAFVRDLAEKHDLPFHASAADTPKFARDQHFGLEAAARQLRHDFFRDLIRQNNANKVATAHTLDDQAETVLLRLMRGAGTKGLAGIYPELKVEGGSIVRPLLSARRAEMRTYLESLGQNWREDATNADLSFTRNRVRHKLLPLIESEFGAAALERLTETAEIARAEEQYWQKQVAGLALAGQDANGLQINALLRAPLALRRRLVRGAAEELGISVGFKHVEQALELARNYRKGEKKLFLPNGVTANVDGTGLRLSLRTSSQSGTGFAYQVRVPGEIEIPELNYRLRFRLVSGGEGSHNPEQLLSSELAGSELVIRNWRTGDRFWPLHSKSDKKVKELLKPGRVPAGQRTLWPVAEQQGEILWVRGLPVSRKFCARGGESAIVVEEFSAS